MSVTGSDILNRRIKILQLLPECHDRANDPEDLAEQIIAAFPRASFEMTSVYFQGYPIRGQHQSLAEHSIYLQLAPESLRGLRLPLRRAVKSIIARNKYDVVICHRYKAVSTMLSVHKCLHVPLCIGVSHGFGEYRTIWRKLHARYHIDDAWRFVGVSPAVRDHLIALHSGFTETNTLSIPNAFDIAAVERCLLERSAARCELGLPENARIVGAIGRLVQVKGHIFLIRAFAKIAPDFPSAHLAIIGDGREAQNLQAEIDRCGLGDRIHLLGWRGRAKQYIRAFDVWAMPSLSEGFGLALIEGMIGRLPVIGSGIPAMRSMLMGAGGLCVPPSDAEALAGALRAYLSLPDDSLQKLGEDAYRYVVRNHRIEDYRAAYRSLVIESLENRKILHSGSHKGLLSDD